jgi:cytochrome P450
LLFTGLGIDDIAAQALVFFSAGFEVVAILLSFSTLLLAVHQDIQQQVKEEVDEVLAEYGGQVTYEAVQRIRRLDNVLSGRKIMEPTWTVMRVLSGMRINHPGLCTPHHESIWTEIWKEIVNFKI